jgi:tetratricopeptide (TPR) repeat protein
MQSYLEKSDFRGAEKLAMGLRGSERTAAYASMAAAAAKKGEYKKAAAYYLQGGQPALALDQAAASAKAGRFDIEIFLSGVEAVKALAAGGDATAARGAVVSIASYRASRAGGLRSPEPADFAALASAAGLSGAAADRALGEGALLLGGSLVLSDGYAKVEAFREAGRRFERAGEAAKASEARALAGDCLLALKQDEDAVAAYVDSGRSREWAYARLGDAYAKSASGLIKAAGYYRQAGAADALAAIGPELARAYLDSGMIAEAEAAFRASGRPESSWAGGIAAALAAKKDWKGALEAYRKAGDVAGARQASLQLGNAAMAARDYKQALARYEEAGEAGGVKEASRKLGDEAFAAKDFAAALASYEKAGYPAGVNAAMLGLGQAALATEDFAAAIAWYGKAGSPWDVGKANRSWARSLADKGDHLGAYQRFLAAEDEEGSRTEAIAHMDSLFGKGDFASGYDFAKRSLAGEAEALLIAGGLRNQGTAAVEALLVAEGQAKRQVWEKLVEAAKEADENGVAIAYLEKLGKKAEVAELREFAAEQALGEGRLLEAYDLYSKTSKGPKEAKATVLSAAIGMRQFAEARVFLEKTGTKPADAASTIADECMKAGEWEAAAELYIAAGKKPKAKEAYAKAADSMADQGAWEDAEALLVKSGAAPGEALRSLADKAVARASYEVAESLLVKGGRAEAQAAREVADAALAKGAYDGAYEYLSGKGEAEASLRVADAAAKAKAAEAAAKYYRLAGRADKAQPWDAKAVDAAISAREWDKAFAKLKEIGEAEAKAAERVGDAAAKAGSAASAVEYYLIAGLDSKAKGLGAKAAAELVAAGSLNLAMENAERSGDKASIEYVRDRLSCRDEMVAYIDENGIDAQAFTERLVSLEKAYGTRVVWESLRNSSLYYLNRGMDILLAVDMENITSSSVDRDLDAANEYTNYSKVLSSLYGDLVKK